MSRLLTLFGGQVVEVDHDGEVVAWLRGRDVLAILAVQDLLGTILHKVLPAPYLEGHKDLGLGFGGGDVEDDAVEIGDGLVDRDGRYSEDRRFVRLAGNPQPSRPQAPLSETLTQRSAPSRPTGSARSGSPGEAWWRVAGGMSCLELVLSLMGVPWPVHQLTAMVGLSVCLVLGPTSSACSMDPPLSSHGASCRWSKRPSSSLPADGRACGHRAGPGDPILSLSYRFNKKKFLMRGASRLQLGVATS